MLVSTVYKGVAQGRKWWKQPSSQESWGSHLGRKNWAQFKVMNSTIVILNFVFYYLLFYFEILHVAFQFLPLRVFPSFHCFSISFPHLSFSHVTLPVPHPLISVSVYSLCSPSSVSLCLPITFLIFVPSVIFDFYFAFPIQSNPTLFVKWFKTTKVDQSTVQKNK